jgi:hypothetical protein
MNKSRYLHVLLGIFILLACKKEKDNAEPVTPYSGTSIKGIVAYAKNDPLPNDTLSVSFSDLKDTIYLTTTPLPAGAPPIDLSEVVIEIEPDKHATVIPASPITFDLNELQEITIQAQDGTMQKYVVKAIVSEPYQVYPKYNAVVTELWSKTGTEMNLAFPGSGKGMTVTGDYLVMLDNAVDKQPSAAIRLYDKMTGNYVKNIDFYEGGWADPRSYSWNLDTDEAGHMVMGRLNSGGAGFMLDYYASINAVPYIFLNSVAGPDLPDNTGKRMNVAGNLAQGKGYVYASAAHYYGAVKQNAQYAVWEFNDGVPVSTRPAVFIYPAATGGWYNAVVQRTSTADNTLYISWCNEDGYPNDDISTWPNLHRINFHVFKPGGATPAQAIDPENFGYRLLDSKVFHLLEGTFMAMAEQSYSTAGPMKLNVFNITDPADYSKKPGSDNYGSFRIFSSPASLPTSNDGRYGHVAVGKLSDNEAVIYVYYPNPDAALAKVHAYKITVTPAP